MLYSEEALGEAGLSSLQGWAQGTRHSRTSEVSVEAESGIGRERQREAERGRERQRERERVRASERASERASDRVKTAYERII